MSNALTYCKLPKNSNVPSSPSTIANEHADISKSSLTNLSHAFKEMSLKLWRGNRVAQVRELMQKEIWPWCVVAGQLRRGRVPLSAPRGQQQQQQQQQQQHRPPTGRQPLRHACRRCGRPVLVPTELSPMKREKFSFRLLVTSRKPT